MSVANRRHLVAIAILAGWALPASLATVVQAQSGTGSFIAKFQDWEVHKARVGDATVCYAAAIPKRSQGKYKLRGETSLLVSFWPSHKIRGQVEVRAGYTYRNRSVARLRFNNGAAFKLRTDADSAWGDNAAQDRKIVKNLSDRARLTVTGRSSRGTRTVDTYSLRGFRAAFARAKSACGM
ncbi:MAG: invasion associated locus B family protein [Rhodospirillaceae bacterium]|nr:invasion associated locus B family protein [Rhodospirillaceae bacterium]